MHGHRRRLDYDRLVLELYGSVRDREAFGAFISSLVEQLRGHMAALHCELLDRQSPLIEQCIGASPSDVTAYEAEYHRDNLWVIRGGALLMEEGVICTDQLATRSEIVRTDFYHGILKPLDVLHGVGLLMWRGEEGQYSVFTSNRTQRYGAYEDDEAWAFCR